MNIDFYLAHGEETWQDIARRASQLMPLGHQEEMMDALMRGLFYPGSPILRNAGSNLNMLSCHSWVVGNSIEEIFEAAKIAGQVFKSGGGGIGLDLSNLSPSDEILKYIKNDDGTARASGPLGFWPLFMMAGEVVGRWRSGKPSGTMGTLNWSHHDAGAWASCKKRDGRFNESNLTVTIDNWGDLSSDDQMFIATQAARNGTPGVAFLDNANVDNPVLAEYGRMTALNVCSEIIGYHAASCLLASINLPAVVQRLGDWAELRRVMKLQVRLLDRIIDINPFPHRQFQQQAQRLRQIGCGLMGWATLLKREGIEYAGPDCLSLADEVGRELASAALAASLELAEEKGGYMAGRARNAFRMAIAPTSHLSSLAGVTSSICLDFNDPAEYAKWLSLPLEIHLRNLEVWARHVDSGISYTLPLENNPDVGEVRDVFSLAHSLGIKTLSVYPDGSRHGQPCNIEGECGL